MQLSIVAVLAFAVAALGNPVSTPKQPAVVARQQNGGPAVQNAAMTDRTGKIVPFNTANVYLAAVDAGLKK